jgi:hypothetical protein
VGLVDREGLPPGSRGSGAVSGQRAEPAPRGPGLSRPGPCLSARRLRSALSTGSGAWIRDGRTREGVRWCLRSSIRESSPSIRLHGINLDTDSDVWEDTHSLQLTECHAITSREVLPLGTTDDSRPVGPGYVRRSSMGFDTALL